MTYLKKRSKAFKDAFKGLMAAFRHEVHMQIHFIGAILAVAAAYFFSITAMEWLVVCLCIVLVMVSEMINSAIERICNMITKEIHPEIGYIKDLSAGFVLLTCIGAFICGLVIFLPKILAIVKFGI